MPAWMTSLLRELVCIPNWRSRSRISTSRRVAANALAAARPTTPAPITMQSTSLKALLSRFDGGRAVCEFIHIGAGRGIRGHQPDRHAGLGHLQRPAIKIE